MPEKPSFIESYAPLGVDSTQVPFRIRPAVVDSSALLADLMWTSKHMRPSGFLMSVRFGTLRPFITPTVWAEVPRKIQEVAADRDVDARLAESVWWCEYVPRLRVVDVQQLPVPLQSEIEGRDSSDAPTFALVGLLGPVVVLAGDKDIIDLGMAAGNWMEATQAARGIAAAAGSGWAGLFSLRAGGYALVASSRGLARLSRSPTGPVVFAVATLALAMTYPLWAHRVRPALAAFRRGARTFLDGALAMANEIAGEYQESDAIWEEATRGEPGSTLVHRAAAALAASPGPLSRTGIARLVLADATQSSQRALVRDLGELLASFAPFFSLNARYWQLGLAGADFGVAGEDESPLLWRTYSEISSPMRGQIGDPGGSKAPRQIDSGSTKGWPSGAGC
ncbi:MAG: hypothetical protein ACRDH9_11205 [Actinomycetota bacterium]